jgi:hypothetical protein
MIAAGDAALPALPALAAAATAMPALASGLNQAAPAQTTAGAPQQGLFTQGIGIYPGAPGDVFSPTLVPDTTTYRNLALRRPATHSSSYDYNLTAQLVTDGIRDTELPNWVAVSSSTQGRLPKPDREIILDHFPPLGIALDGALVSVEVQIAGGVAAPAVDRVAVFVVMPDYVPAGALQFSVSVTPGNRSPPRRIRWRSLRRTTRPTGPVAPISTFLPWRSTTCAATASTRWRASSRKISQTPSSHSGRSVRSSSTRAISACRSAALTASPAHG